MTIRPGLLERMCFDKHAFVRRSQARRAKRERARWFGCTFSIYRCPICGWWHLTTRRSA